MLRVPLIFSVRTPRFLSHASTIIFFHSVICSSSPRSLYGYTLSVHCCCRPSIYIASALLFISFWQIWGFFCRDWNFPLEASNLNLLVTMENGSVSKPMVPEANTKPSIPYIPWFNLGDFLSDTPPKIPFSPFKATQIHPRSVPLVHPIRYISPTSEMTRNNPSGNTPSKVRKPKSCKKNSIEDVAEVLGPKKPRSSGKKKGQTMPVETRERNPNTGIQISSFDFSCLPSPVCSCTGVARICYSWGAGGWQSTCCSTSVSQYPLPLK